MTKFQFSLRRVLDFRRLRAGVARSALDRLQAEYGLVPPEHAGAAMPAERVPELLAA